MPYPLKLYVWDSLNCFRDYYHGYAFALARTRIQAIDVVLKGYNIDDPHRLLDPSQVIEARQELEEKPPKVYTYPIGIRITGGS